MRRAATCASCFSTGRSRSSSGRRWSSRRLQKSKLDWDFVVGTAPEGKKPVGTYGGWNLVVYKSSTHQDAAWKFVQFLTRPDVNGAVVDLIPANVQAATDFLAEEPQGSGPDPGAPEQCAPRPLSPRYLEVSDIEVDAGAGRAVRQGRGAGGGDGCKAIDALAPVTLPSPGAADLPLPGAWPARCMRGARTRMTAGCAAAGRAGDGAGRRAHVLSDDRHGHREPLFDLIHQPEAAIRRLRATRAFCRPDLLARWSSIPSSGPRASWRCRTCSASSSRCCSNQRLPGTGRDAFAGAAAVGAAGRGRRPSCGASCTIRSSA